MSEKRPGFYKDRHGEWQPDRRKGDRRAPRANAGDDGERRQYYRRKADREYLESQDHKAMIKEALEDFAEEHDGHL